MAGQLGSGDGWLSPKVGQNAMLERLSREIRWYRFEKLLVRLQREEAAGPPFAPLMMLRALLLQQWYRLSDDELEEAISDRVSFRKFLGLPLEAAPPDHAALCRFRNRLEEAGLADRLFREFARQLENRGLLVKQGAMVDASIVESPGRPASSASAATASPATPATSASSPLQRT